jgi:5-methylcytosine-specific restriction endonuclease McrA
MYARKRWAMPRRHKLSLNPICELCDRTLANEVHHKVAMEEGGAKYDLDNLISACKPCHSRETRREVVARYRGEGTASPPSPALVAG